LATKKALAATASEVSKTISIGISDATLEAINAGAEVVGAPATATVSLTNAAVYVDGENNYPFSVTFSWQDTV
jgi:hypothetical protein